MTRRIAATLVCLLCAQFAVAAAQDVRDEVRQVAARVAPPPAPLATAAADPARLPSREAPSSEAARQARDDRSWIERHPVWTGALVGFAVGFTAPFLTEDSFISPTGAGIVWGGVGAGIGALAGWGIGLAHDDPNAQVRHRRR